MLDENICSKYTFDWFDGDPLYKCSVCGESIIGTAYETDLNTHSYFNCLRDHTFLEGTDVIVDDKIYLCCDTPCKEQLELTGVFDQPYYTLLDSPRREKEKDEDEV